MFFILKSRRIEIKEPTFYENYQAYFQIFSTMNFILALMIGCVYLYHRYTKKK